MEALRFNLKLIKKGQIFLQNLPLKKGEDVEVMVIYEHKKKSLKKSAASAILKSELIGLWSKRKDIGDSIAFARALRQQAQSRGLGHDSD